MKVVDEMGFNNPGTKLLLYFPGFNGVLGYNVKYRANEFFEKLSYGPASFTLSGYSQGVVPANTWTDEYKFEWIDNRRIGHEKTNMFYYENADRLLDVNMTIQPGILRHYIHYPERTTFFSYLDVAVNPDKGDDIGFFRKNFNMVFLPFLENTFSTYNKTNVDLRTYVDFEYAEYVVEMITNTSELRDMWQEKGNVKKKILPAYAEFTTNAFKRAYERQFGITSPIPLEDIL